MNEIKKIPYFSWCGNNGFGNECVFLGEFSNNEGHDHDNAYLKESALGLVSDFLICGETLDSWIVSLSCIFENWDKCQGTVVLLWSSFDFSVLENIDYETALDDETEYAWVLKDSGDVEYFLKTLAKGLENKKNSFIGINGEGECDDCLETDKITFIK